MGRKADGRRDPRQVRGFASSKDALTALENEVVRRRTGAFFDPTTGTTEQFLAQWLDATAPARRASSQISYASVLRTRVIPRIGRVPLAKLTTLQLQAMYRQLLATHAPKTVQNTHRIVRAAFKQAVLWELIPRDPSLAVKLGIPKSKRAVAYWTPAEARQFLREAGANGDPSLPLWRLMLDTGVRIGEALALRWADVDLAKRRLRIDRTMTKGESGEIVIGLDPKTAESRRALALDPATVELLRAVQREQQLRRIARADIWTDLDLVFDRGDGAFLKPSTVGHRLDASIARTGVKRVTPHGLRHTNATTLLLAGVAMKVVSRRLGHANIAVTADQYGHVTDDADESAAETLGRILGAS